MCIRICPRAQYKVSDSLLFIYLVFSHQCGDFSACTPYSYWGSEHCGYPSQGGDCANFVSQCVLAGGHPPLNTGDPCRGYPCGVEEIGAQKLSNCLQSFGWTASCGYMMGPPPEIEAGDVLVCFNGDGCTGGAHAVFVTSRNGDDATISCHSNEREDVSYTYMGESMPYYMWLHAP